MEPSPSALKTGSLVLPAVCAVAIFLVLPVLSVLWLGFTDYEMAGTDASFIGLENYRELLSDQTFRLSLRNTGLYALTVMPASMILSLGAALLIEAQGWGRSLFRTIWFLPVVSLMVAMAVVWQYLFHPSLGPVNALFRLFGREGPNWLGSSSQALFSLALIGIWQSTGFNVVLFLAGLATIPRDLYAAANVDGARNAWTRFRLVTLPMLGPTLLFVATLSLINAVKVFDAVAALTQGGPRKSTEVLLWTIYQEGFVHLRVGYAAAMTVVFLLILLAAVCLKILFLERRVHYS